MTVIGTSAVVCFKDTTDPYVNHVIEIMTRLGFVVSNTIATDFTGLLVTNDIQIARSCLGNTQLKVIFLTDRICNGDFLRQDGVVVCTTKDFEKNLKYFAPTKVPPRN